MLLCRYLLDDSNIGGHCVKQTALHNVGGPRPSVEDLSRTKTDLPWARKNCASRWAFRLVLQHQLFPGSLTNPTNFGFASFLVITWYFLTCLSILKSSKRGTATKCQHFESLLVSYLLLSCFPNHVIWPSPESEQEGSTQGHGCKEVQLNWEWGGSGGHYC